MDQVPLWPDDDDHPAMAPRQWQPRCSDCQRRIWSADSIRRRRGGRCHRLARRVAIRIRAQPPGDIPGQTTAFDIPARPAG